MRTASLFVDRFAPRAVPRFAAAAFAALLHVAAITGFLILIGTVEWTPIERDSDVVILPEVETKQPPAQPPEVVIERSTELPNVPLPDIQFTAGDGAIAVPVEHDAPAKPPIVEQATSALLAVPIFPPRTDPARPLRAIYPSTARRLGEEGSVRLSFIVLADGSVDTSSIDIVTSSGHPRLDDAARAALRRSRFLPATRGGEAIAQRHEYRITFALTEGDGAS